MIITKNPELSKEIYHNIHDRIARDREGIHLSDCIYCVRKAYFRKAGLAPPPTREQVIMWMTGYAFQAYMFPLDEEIPLTVDGIVCTPDIARGIEVKSTRGSMDKFDLEEQETYKMQILGYCKALNKLEYDLVVFFVCGNYKPPFPDYDCWHIVVTREEVDDNWNFLLNRAVKLQIALETGNPPDTDCRDWEWKYCECIDLCPETTCYKKKYILGGKK